MYIWIIGVLLFGYTIGCLHGSIVAQKISGVNLKETGVKNAGASNATIVLGKKFGALVAAIDIGKGAAAVLLVRYLATIAELPQESVTLLLFLVGAAAVIGHNFPFYMSFNGGKGTATVIGVLLALDWRVGLAGFVLFLIVTLVTDFLVYRCVDVIHDALGDGRLDRRILADSSCCITLCNRCVEAYREFQADERR